ncbi:hypothetical protein BV25DRAFT_1822545 [Artomyces pyxidatus]|uniref:Uncharacterized protein n=1 Tax=Artomyces pyxidatus TaxID=48021 RepID=A0ACB8T929_9AGAM|nr:hypothetical protein BV25DRAFT_1822545 [Artomyces pyxidatus]
MSKACVEVRRLSLVLSALCCSVYFTNNSQYRPMHSRTQTLRYGKLDGRENLFSRRQPGKSNEGLRQEIPNSEKEGRMSVDTACATPACSASQGYGNTSHEKQMHVPSRHTKGRSRRASLQASCPHRVLRACGGDRSAGDGGRAK